MNLGYLFLLFLVLKLTGVVAWSWWIVALPLWILPALIVALVVVILSIALTATIAGR